jgi:hypothetical protein
MSNVDFNSILDTDFDSIEKPKPLPVGTYKFLILDVTSGVSQNKGTPYIELQCQPLSPGADVDQAMLDMAKMSKKKLRLTFWMSEDARWRFKAFIEKTLNLSVHGMTIKAIIPQLKGQSFDGYVTQGISEKSGEIFNNIDRVV